MKLRDHGPIVIDTFNGLWRRGDVENTPLDHFADCNNIQFRGNNSFQTRDGLDIAQSVAVPLSNIKRIYNYPTPTGNTLIVLTIDSAGFGNIYHVVNSTTTYGPLLSILGMTDFAFIPYAGRAYISPFATFVVGGLNVEKGMQNQFLYVYAGDGTLARLAAGQPLIGIGLPPATTLTSHDAPAAAPTFALSGTWPAGSSHTPLNGATLSYTYLYSDGVESLPSASSAALTGDDGTSGWAITIVNGGANVVGRKLYISLLGAQNYLIVNNNTTTALASISISTFVPFTNVPVTFIASFDPVFSLITGVGNPPTSIIIPGQAGNLSITNGSAGHTDPGFHLFGFVSETESGYLTPPGDITGFTTLAGSSVSFGNVPTSNITITSQLISLLMLNDNEEYDEEESIFLQPPNILFLREQHEEDENNFIINFIFPQVTVVADPTIIKRLLVATKAITAYNGNPTGYIFYFVPGAVINNNTDSFLNNISFFDADLLDDASHLFDNYSQIPAGAVLGLYHNRLVVAATYTDISLGLVSAQGEPEAINQIDGLFIVPLDGNPITNVQELRDVLYVTKRSRTVAFPDTGDVPSSWPLTIIDNALGTSVHGIATVLDSGSSSVDFLIIATYQGISLFNGKYITPELSWKIEAFWKSLSRPDFRKIQILNASIQKEIYIILPDSNLLVGNYSNGMDQMKIRWALQSFKMGINTIAVQNIDQIIVGADNS